MLKIKGEKMTKEECEIETSNAIMEMRNQIAELEKENAKLKKELKISQRCWQDQKNISLNANCSLHKAKELLTKWVELFRPKGGNILPTPIQVETEQFLNGGKK